MVFLHLQSASLYTIQLLQVNIYTFDHILILTKTLAEKPPLKPVTSSVSCWPSGVNYSIPLISVRVSEGATHTSFDVSEQASFKGYFISLVVICVK